VKEGVGEKGRGRAEAGGEVSLREVEAEAAERTDDTTGQGGEAHDEEDDGQTLPEDLPRRTVGGKGGEGKRRRDEKESG